MVANVTKRQHNCIRFYFKHLKIWKMLIDVLWLVLCTASRTLSFVLPDCKLAQCCRSIGSASHDTFNGRGRGAWDV